MKLINIVLPLILREVIDSILCDPSKKKNDWFIHFSDSKCRTHQEVYLLIGIYAASKFFKDTIGHIRALPWAYVSAKAEVKIAHEVYDNV